MLARCAAKLRLNLRLNLRLERLARWAFIATSMLALTACGNLRGLRMLSPSSFGMEKMAPGLYVEPAMAATEREALQRHLETGKAEVRRHYGTLTARPVVVACITTECATRFGTYGEPAAALNDFAIRLSPNSQGRTAALIAHEWSHAEMHHRSGWWLMRKMPRWFDEGLAVVIADEPRHSENNWREIQRRGLQTPALAALTTFSDWNTAIKAYGETQPAGPDNLHLVYSTAGHHVRVWLACAGASAPLELLEALRAGDGFDEAYARIGRKCLPSRG